MRAAEPPRRKSKTYCLRPFDARPPAWTSERRHSELLEILQRAVIDIRLWQVLPAEILAPAESTYLLPVGDAQVLDRDYIRETL